MRGSAYMCVHEYVSSNDIFLCARVCVRVCGFAACSPFWLPLLRV